MDDTVSFSRRQDVRTKEKPRATGRVSDLRREGQREEAADTLIEKLNQSRQESAGGTLLFFEAIRTLAVLAAPFFEVLNLVLEKIPRLLTSRSSEVEIREITQEKLKENFPNLAKDIAIIQRASSWYEQHSGQTVETLCKRPSKYLHRLGEEAEELFDLLDEIQPSEQPLIGDRDVLSPDQHALHEP